MKKLVQLLFLSLFLLPGVAFAATVGFVPSSGIWFSKTEFAPGETIRIYTVVVNNDYPSLSGTVTFYDNGTNIDSVEVKGLTKESAQQIRVLWQPSEGAHAVAARFTRAVAIDEKGAQKVLDVSTINSVAGAPLRVGDAALESTPIVVSPTSTATTLGAVTVETSASGSQTGGVGSQTEVQVKKEGSKLVLAPERVLGMSTGEGATMAPDSTKQSGSDDVFAKNREALDKAGEVVSTLTTTAGTISRVYTGTKSAFEKGQEYYAKGEEQWQKVQPYVERASPYWMKLSNNNDPKRVAIVIGGTILVFYTIRFFWRRRDRYELERY